MTSAPTPWTLRPLTAVAVAIVAVVITWIVVVPPSGLVASIGPFTGVAAASAPIAVAWVLAAVGYGRLLVWWMPGRERWSITIAIGLTGLMWLDNLLGRVGMLLPVVAWVILIVGWIPMIIDAIAFSRRMRMDQRPNVPQVPAIALLVVPAITVLGITACSSPGILWLTEFGGYDALSYHLQLPKEWLHDGRLQAYQHNVYSALPSGVEGIYLHLAAFVGDGIAVGTTCQWLHAIMAAIAALMLVDLVREHAGLTAGIIAGTIVITTPWSIVVGSLAYNEMVTILLAIGAVRALDDLRQSPLVTSAVVGALLAGTMLAKLSSAGLIVGPVVLLALPAFDRSTRRRAPIMMITAVLAGLFVLAPWLIGNAHDLGQPTFPFLTSIFGPAHWNEAQIAQWNAGHIGGRTFTERLAGVWDEWLRFGIGAAPSSEPWRPQWSIIPLLTLIAIPIACLTGPYRRLAGVLSLALLAQLCFWMFFTHVKSRFMLPALPCMATIITLAIMQLRGRSAIPFAAAGILFVNTAMLLSIVAREGDDPLRGVRTTGVQTGDALDESQQRQEARSRRPAVFVNHFATDDERVMLIGDAAPYYMRPGRVVYATVWDEHPLLHGVDTNDFDDATLRDACRALDIAYVIVQYPMLENWRVSGWLDPRLEPSAVRSLLEAAGTVLAVYPDGSVLYALKPR